MRYLVILFLVFIVYSLGAALFHMVRSKGGNTDPRVFRSLAIRVALSVTLFAILMISFRMGWIGERL